MRDFVLRHWFSIFIQALPVRRRIDLWNWATQPAKPVAYPSE